MIRLIPRPVKSLLHPLMVDPHPSQKLAPPKAQEDKYP